MAEWIQIATADEIEPGTGKEFTVNGRIVAVFNTDGEFHAMDGICAHAGGPVAAGPLDGNIVTCPWHGWQYDVTTGANCLNAQICLQSFPIRVEGNAIEVQLS